ncbi:Virulence-associated E family protein (fragment) [Bosea sp. 62]|uniref:virulence-associated E family protein n=1 Tax=unclassified Bosea (in: a-proteobacteria) TaxID=2653178 RepID=UPI001256CB42
MNIYHLDQFSEFREPAAAAIVALGDVDVAQIAALSVNELSARVPGAVRALIEAGDDPERPMGQDGARFPSRSEVVFSVACGLARAGCTEHQIAGVLINRAHAISASILEKKAPEKYALKQARAAVTAVGNGWPDTTQKGNPRPTLRNAIVAFQRLGVQASHDLFRRRHMVLGLKLEAFQGELTDDFSAMLRKTVLDEFGFDPGREHVRDALHMMALENSYHPIRDYLAGLEWDGKPRIDTLLVDYFGAEDTPLNRAIGRIVPIAAVRRVRRPGCKFDEILVLEGKQGTGKSTALAILAGAENHSDQEILTLDKRAQMEAMAGKWIYELSELEGLRKADAAKVKAFASQGSDRARMAYAYFADERPRECIFIGTTNDDHYLSDPTGNRRFWPVRTGAIDLEALARDRDQLWAEAAVLEAADEPIRLSQELWEAASAEQAARTAFDPWLDTLASVRGEEGNGTTVKASTKHLLSYVLNIEVGRQKHPDATRLGACMRALGWDGPKSMRVHGVNVRGYERPQPDDWKPDMAEAITARKTDTGPA